MVLWYAVERGRDQGVVLVPHRNRAGKYIASRTRFEKDYVYADSEEELLRLMAQGFRVRMSNPSCHHAPRLISPGHIRRI